MREEPNCAATQRQRNPDHHGLMQHKILKILELVVGDDVSAGHSPESHIEWIHDPNKLIHLEQQS